MEHRAGSKALRFLAAAAGVVAGGAMALGQVGSTGSKGAPPDPAMTPTNVLPKAVKKVVVQRVPPPGPRGGNDNCGGATPIFGNSGTAPTDNTSATHDGATTCGATATSPDVWFDYTAGLDGNATFSFCPSEGGSATYDTVLGAFDSCGGTQLACNDDFCGLQSSVTFPVTNGAHYFVCVSGFAGSTGTGVLGWNVVGPCVDCPPGAIDEGEPDCGLPIDTVNGGCNSTPPVFSLVSPGQTVCGTCGTGPGPTGLDTRDTDWWQVDIAAPTFLTWNVTADFPVLIGMVASPCPQTAFITGTSFTSAQCVPVTSSATLQPGTYYMFVAPSVFTGVACGAHYIATLAADSSATGACCLPGGCQVAHPGACAAMGGMYAGDNTNCGGQNYTNSSCGNAFEDISTTGSPGPACDDCGVNAPIGFDFSFFGVSHNTINVCSNGYLTFGTSTGVFTNGVIPDPALPNDLIAPYWDDWFPTTAANGTVVFQTLGSAPNRRFVAQWNNVLHFGTTTERATFEAILFETTNAIEFRYALTDAADTPTIGIENSDGTAGISVAPGSQGTCTNFAAEDTGNPCQASCPCDFDHSGVLNSQDFFDFLNCFFTPGCADADFNNSGSVNSQDFFDFLNCFFQPPPGCG